MNPDRPARPGLCSVTLRGLDPLAVLDHARDAGLEAIEWGGDVHVPHPQAAAHVREQTRAAGIAVASYGSYLRLGDPDPAVRPESVVATAASLGARRIRVWAGGTGSADATAAQRADVIAAARELGDRADEIGAAVALEFHGGTLTDTAESTARLLDDIDHERVRTYWQPPVDLPDEAAVAGFGLLAERVVGIHVFSWWPGQRRLPLSGRERLWRRIVDLLPERAEPMDLLLEFVADDDPNALRRDAAFLAELLRRA